MSMSELWRENKSKDPGLDLASILSAARIMASSLSPNIDITFAGIKAAATDRKTIALSTKVLGNSYPVDGDKVDCLMGLTVHEMGHVLFSPEKAQLLKAIDKRLGLSRRPRLLEDMVNTLEDIYVDHLMSAFPGYRDYLKAAMQFAVAGVSPDKITGILNRRVTQQEMINAFGAIAIAGFPVPSDILPENMGILGKLVTIAQKMCANTMKREKAITDSWKIISSLPEQILPEEKLPSKMPKGQPAPDQEPDQSQSDESGGDEAENTDGDDGQEQDTETTKPKYGGDEAEDTETTELEQDDADEEQDQPDGDKDQQCDAEPDPEDNSPESDSISISRMLNASIDYKVKLDSDVADDVSQALIDKREDLTQMLSLLAKEADTVIAYTPNECAEATTKARKETQQVEEALRRILQDLRLRRTEDYRGLYSGKISARRLYRAGYGDKRVFQRRERPGEINMAVCLLMDLSGSMINTRPLIEQVVVALCDAFQKEKLEFIALGYSGHRHIAYIPRLHDREVGKVYLDLDRSKVWDTTPSYEGLAAAIAQLLRLGGNKPKVLFHCTDGNPDKPGMHAIPDLLNNARNKGIMDIHIAMGDYLSEGRFGDIYGEVVTISDISQLPTVIEKKLRDKLGI